MSQWVGLGLLVVCGLSVGALGQARPLPGPDVQQIYLRLLPQIEKIPIFDPCGTATSMSRTSSLLKNGLSG